MRDDGTHPRRGGSPCSFGPILAVLADPLSLRVLDAMRCGEPTAARIARHTGAPREVVAERLGRLEAAGVVERCGPDRPPSVYRLSRAAEELLLGAPAEPG